MRCNSFHSILLMVGFVLLAGCNSPETPLSRSEDSPIETKSDTPPESPPEAKVDLSIPQLDPKPVIWLSDWPGVAAVPAARQKAQDLTYRADRLKADERFEEAEENYQKAIQADPEWSYPVYQLACNYELWNQHDRAMRQFKKAVELGFDEFPTALNDSELGRIRDDADFTDALLEIRERYVAASGERVGQPIAVRPRGSKPRDGWPLMLLLHGYGDTNLSYLDFARQWAKLGFLSVAIPGSVPQAAGRYAWSMDSTQQTHQDLQKIIQSSLLDGLVNTEKMFLLGFSQGALHAMLLTAENPDIYAGVVGVSPGGSMWERLETPPINRSGRPARCVFIHGLQEAHAPYVRIWSKACNAAGWQFDSRTHPGSHHFPEDWDTIRPKIAAFLTR